MNEQQNFKEREEARQRQQGQNAQPIEFQSVEEMLRRDAVDQTPPAAVAERIKASLETEPPARPWWRRIFS